jgi:hypothetical protein
MVGGGGGGGVGGVVVRWFGGGGSVGIFGCGGCEMCMWKMGTALEERDAAWL